MVTSCVSCAVLQFVDEIIYPAAAYPGHAIRHVKENIEIKKLHAKSTKGGALAGRNRTTWPNRKVFPDKPVLCRLMADC